MYRLQDFVESSQQATTISQLQSMYSEAMNSEGYGNSIFTSVHGREVSQLHWLEFPEGYPEYYFKNEWEKIDPVLACALRARKPFLWNDAIENARLSKPQIGLLNECREIGVHSGVVFPFHGPGNQLEIMSISKRTNDSTDKKRLGLLHAISIQTWTRFLELTEDDPVPVLDFVDLTPREMEVLRWSKSGKTYSDISEILSISRKTVEYHIRNAMDKLGANNKTSAVVIAIHRGIIDF